MKHSIGDLPAGGWMVTRDDSVTRRRLMYLADGLMKAVPPTWKWREDVGYGKNANGGRAGAFITHRSLPETQDVTFEESHRARAHTKLPGFYAS